MVWILGNKAYVISLGLEVTGNYFWRWRSIFLHDNSWQRVILGLFLIWSVISFFGLVRLEKDRRYSYVWVRCSKIISVSKLGSTTSPVFFNFFFFWCNNVVCRSLSSPSTSRAASSTSSQRTTAIRSGRGSGCPWRTSASTACGSGTSPQCTGPLSL